MSSVLNALDRQSATWKKLEKYLNERLVTHRRKNDADQPDESTAKIRGRIAEVLDILALGGTPEPVAEVGDDPKFD